MCEDYDFFTKLRDIDGALVINEILAMDKGEQRVRAWTDVSMQAMKQKVALHYDEYGICVHTLHPKSTSHSWAKHEVPLDEVSGLDVAELGLDLLNTYTTRF